MATIAFVQSYPYDADLGGDAAYIQAFAQYLSRAGHEVHGLVSDITRGRTSPVYRSAYSIEKFRTWQVRNAVRIGQKAFVGPPATLLRKLSNLPRSEPTTDGWVPREAAWVDRTLSRIRPTATVLVHDAVHFAPHLENASAIFALVGHIPTRRNLIDDHRRGSRTEQMLSTNGTTLAASLKAADAIGFNSRDDIAYAAKHLIDGNMCYVGMGYPDVPRCPSSDEPVVLLVGNATTPNRSALTWFLDRVWPTVLDAHPAARFRVLGQIAFTDVAKPTKSVEYVGPVPDLASEYQRAQAVVAPLVTGTAGVKIKVAEAISYGRPIVTTSIGVDNLDKHQLDDAAIVADRPEDFARGVIALLSDADFRKTKSAGAIQVFQKHFSYSACYGDFSTWLDRTIAASSHQSSDLQAIPACIGARWRHRLAEPSHSVAKMSERGQYG